MIEVYKKPESEEAVKTLVEETQDTFRTYSQKRESWATHAQEDREFRLGKQWTAEQRDTLKSRGQAPIVINRIHPAVEDLHSESLLVKIVIIKLLRYSMVC